MTTDRDPALQLAIDAMVVPGIVVDHRIIADGDETALLPEERGAFAHSVTKVQRASGAARKVARGLLLQFGQPSAPLVKSASGAPRWPAGFVGSLAHDAGIAMAALARQSDFGGIGVDVEPAEPLNAELLSIVATERERQEAVGERLRGRVLFVVKEAVYKAVHPLDGQFLEHHDVEVDVLRGIASVRGGRLVPFRYCVATHIVALAYVAG
jgi:4'-phosphopantetheinyl transferase EntD